MINAKYILLLLLPLCAQVHIQASQDNTAANGNIICSLADQNKDKLIPSPYVMKDEDASRFQTCVFAD